MRGGRGIAAGLGVLIAAGAAWWLLASDASPPVEPALARADAARGPEAAVTALGRLEPRDGVIRVAGPSRPSVVVTRLLVDEGDEVEAGQTLAVLDSEATRRSEVVSLEAELAHDEAELRRHEALYRDGVVSVSERDTWRTKADVTRARLAQARAELALDTVRAPIDGRVLEIYAREGERVGEDGILELGRTDEMFAVAEVYETDVQRVRLGQRASVTSPALREPLAGKVEKIHLKVGKQDVLATDPAARTDARVVEVEIRLDDGTHAAGLTNLQVDVAIEP